MNKNHNLQKKKEALHEFKIATEFRFAIQLFPYLLCIFFCKCRFIEYTSLNLTNWKAIRKYNKGITCIHTKKMKKNCEQGNIMKCFWCSLCKALPSLTHHHQSLLDPIRHHLRLLQNIKKFLNSQFSVTNHYYTDNIQVTLEGSNSRSKTVVPFFLLYKTKQIYSLSLELPAGLGVLIGCFHKWHCPCVLFMRL